MNKINTRLNGGILPRSKDENVPTFTFPPVDLTGSGKFYEACLQLWEKGVLSTRTMMSMSGYDMDQEVKRRRAEDADGVTETLLPRDAKENGDSTENKQTENKKPGRPALDDNERNSDPADAITGKQPKPSSPDGSL